MKGFSIDYNISPCGKPKPKAIKIKLSNEELKTHDYLDEYLTDTQKKQKTKKLKAGGSLLLSLSIPIVKKIFEYLKKKKEGSGLSKHEGGFLPILLAALGAIGSLAGGAAAITSAVHKKQKEEAELAEQKRHNLVIEKKVGQGCPRTKKGKKKK